MDAQHISALFERATIAALKDQGDAMRGLGSQNNSGLVVCHVSENESNTKRSKGSILKSCQRCALKVRFTFDSMTRWSQEMCV